MRLYRNRRAPGLYCSASIIVVPTTFTTTRKSWFGGDVISNHVHATGDVVVNVSGYHVYMPKATFFADWEAVG